ncbi:UNVERIFIED_CONTAM: hypothetical protein Slati_0475400 [Sesamum latifolium]|uniref:Uncharacterized protein n=1 Tax=Sesamum latifolium TaxID=2727402 RepID=A0AAW2XWW7_9LAMI
MAPPQHKAVVPALSSTPQDSQLVVKQVEGTYEAKEETMIQYLQQIADLKIKFHHFQIIQISREERQAYNHGEDWRTPIIKWIEEGLLPENRWEAARLKTRATRFIMQEHILYKKFYTHPLLRCLSIEGIYILQEIHSGCCGAHVGTRILANKALRAGPKNTRMVSRLAHQAKIHHSGYPQANGQVEVTNRILIQGIKRRLERVGGNWAEELTSVMWAYRTTPEGLLEKALSH